MREIATGFQCSFSHLESFLIGLVPLFALWNIVWELRFQVKGMQQ